MYARFFLFVLIFKYIRQIIRISNDDKKIKKCIKHEICFFFSSSLDKCLCLEKVAKLQTEHLLYVCETRMVEKLRYFIGLCSL